MTLDLHDAAMFIDSITPRDLDDLSLLLSDPGMPPQERLSMGRFATHLIRAEIHEADGGMDADLLAFLLARWDFSLHDPDTDIDDILEPFEVHLEDASGVLGQDLGELRAGIARLGMRGVIGATPKGDIVLVRFSSVAVAIASKVAQLAYREFYIRHGRVLHGLAEHHLSMIVEHLTDEEARIDRALPSLARVRENLEAVEASSTPDQLMIDWKVAPLRMYDWLDRLAAVENELSNTTGYRELGLRHELQLRRRERTAICSRQPSPCRTEA